MTLTKMWVPICLYCLNCTKFGQLILRKIIKIVATRCQILRLKCTKFDFGWGSPLGELTALPRPPGWIWGALRLRGVGGQGRGGKGGGEGKVRRWERRGGKAKGRKGEGLSLPKVNLLVKSLSVFFTTFSYCVVFIIEVCIVLIYYFRREKVGRSEKSRLLGGSEKNRLLNGVEGPTYNVTCAVQNDYCLPEHKFRDLPVVNDPPHCVRTHAMSQPAAQWRF